jgi:hypothetical protein
VNASASTAQHLAELGQRYDAHLSALRRSATLMLASLNAAADALAADVAPPAAPDDAPRSSYDP